MISAGEFNALISIERDAVTRVGGAEFRTAEIYAQSIWAAARPVSGREYLQQQQAGSEVTWRFTLRYRSDILATDRVVWKGARYEIQAVLPDERAGEVVLMAWCANGQ
jgi:SPP1 family predicted phage head-tail adaptor